MGRREDIFPEFRLQNTSRDQLVLSGSEAEADQLVLMPKNEDAFHFAYVDLVYDPLQFAQDQQLTLPALHVGLAHRRSDEIREPQDRKFARHRKVPVITREANIGLRASSQIWWWHGLDAV